MFVPYASEISAKSYRPNSTKFWVFDQKKPVFYNHFWQRGDAILEDVSLAEIIFNAKLFIIFQCSKNYGTPTLVTRLNVAPNMADPINLNENLL